MSGSNSDWIWKMPTAPEAEVRARAVHDAWNALVDACSLAADWGIISAVTLHDGTTISTADMGALNCFVQRHL